MASALRWHWNLDGDRVCDDCGAEVWTFDGGYICSRCDRQAEGDDEVPAEPTESPAERTPMPTQRADTSEPQRQ